VAVLALQKPLDDATPSRWSRRHAQLGDLAAPGAWGAIGLTAAIVVVALWLPLSVVVIRKCALARRIVVWGRAREPGDTRTTSPF
jgi:hypothetical protein